jgi:hypothetical protein
MNSRNCATQSPVAWGSSAMASRTVEQWIGEGSVPLEAEALEEDDDGAGDGAGGARLDEAERVGGARAWSAARVGVGTRRTGAGGFSSGSSGSSSGFPSNTASRRLRRWRSYARAGAVKARRSGRCPSSRNSTGCILARCLGAWMSEICLAHSGHASAGRVRLGR